MKEILFWFAAIFTIIGFIIRYKSKIIELLKRRVPLWVILLIIALFISIFIFFITIRNDYQNIIAFEEPREVTSKRIESATPVSAEFLQGSTGSISIWVFIQPFGVGIRELKNNRYIVAHDTNSGYEKEINDQINIC